MRPIQTSMSMHLAATALLAGQVMAVAFALAASTPPWGRALALGVMAVLAAASVRAVAALQPVRRETQRD